VTRKREFFSTSEVAQILGISPFTIRRYIRLRKLKAVKLENSYRVRQADLDEFLKAREVETEEELDALDTAEEVAAPRKKPVAAQPTPRRAQRKPTRKPQPRVAKPRREEE
jgi:excisionase family DNA binding protein